MQQQSWTSNWNVANVIGNKTHDYYTKHYPIMNHQIITFIIQSLPWVYWSFIYLSNNLYTLELG